MKRINSLIIIAALAVLSGCASKQQPLSPPDAAKIPVVKELHGDKLTDDYAWLRDRENPEVISYLKAENSYAEKMMKDTKKLQKKIFREFIERIDETDLSVPVKRGEYFYYSRAEKGNQYSIQCRKKGSMDAEEEVLLDLNRLGEGMEYLGLGSFDVSPDNNLLGYSLDQTGAEKYTVFFKDLRTGSMLDDTLENSDGGVAWSNDNKTVFYTVQNEIGLPFKVFRHVLGTPQSDDELVFHEQDNTFYLFIAKTKSMKYIMVYSGSGTTSEVTLFDADNPFAPGFTVHPRQTGLEYSVSHHSDRFYILYNENAVNFKLAVTPVSAYTKDNWADIISHRPDVLLSDIELFSDFMVLSERIEGQEQLRIISLKDNKEHYISFPEELFEVETGPNLEFNTELLRLGYDSMITPYTVYDYNMKSREMVELKKMKVYGGYDPANYSTERVFAKAEDGVSVPICLVYRKDLKKDGSNPAVLEGYGAYGSMTDPYFSSLRISLLDRGFVYAMAQIRGGGELGREWYNNGRVMHKKNSFTDFISCAEHLISNGYTSKEKLAATGGSAGGLLIGAVSNMRPDLFGALIADVPFVDVINTMLDDTIPLTTYEYDEWGNPDNKEHYIYMKSYSPYDNVTDRCYPDMLIEAGLNDPRVGFWEPAKWTAKLRDHHNCGNMIIFRTDMVSGHGGPSGKYDFYELLAFQYAFYMKALGLEMK